MARVPGFIGPSYTDRSLPVNAERSVNLFVEKVESNGGSNDVILRATPGKRTFATMGDAPIRALFAQDDRAWCVAGVTLYELYSTGGYTPLGTVAADDNPAWIASNGQAGYQLFIVSGGSGYIFDLRTSAFTTIGGGFPSAARGAAYLDGYFLTMSGIAVYASNLNNGTTWSATSKAQRSIASDDLRAFLVDDHKILWYIGSKTSEPWFDSALSPFAFTPVPSAFMGHGTCAPYSVAKFDNSLFMLGQSESGDRYAVVIGNGYVAQRVSTHAVEQAWRQYATVFDARTWVYTDEGHTFAVVTFPTANATWVYDASTGAWHERGAWNTSRGDFDADVAGCHCFAFGKHLVGSRTSSAVYELTMDVYADGDRPRRWLRRTPHLQDERRRLYYRWVELVADTGVGLTTGKGSDPQACLRLSDDGGRTWGNERWRSLGAQGAYRTRVRWNRLGQARDRVFEISGTDPVRTTLIDLLAGMDA